MMIGYRPPRNLDKASWLANRNVATTTRAMPRRGWLTPDSGVLELMALSMTARLDAAPREGRAGVAWRMQQLGF
ncbi:hypothetical protein D3C77_752140 [compost metagenome]